MALLPLDTVVRNSSPDTDAIEMQVEQDLRHFVAAPFRNIKAELLWLGNNLVCACAREGIP